METLKTLISNVLDNSESLCLDSAEDKQTLLDSIMKALISFMFATDAVNYVEKYKLNAFINKNKRTGKYDVVHTYVDALKGKLVEWED